MLRLTLDIKDNQVDHIVYPDMQTMRSWSACNAVWHVPLKQVAFLSVLPYPVTFDSAVKRMTNPVAIYALNVYSTNFEFLQIYGKVYCMANEIQLLRPTEFKSFVLYLGTFHTAQALLKYTRTSLDWSGAENMWLPAGVYGPTVHHNSIINGDHYSRSPDAQTSVAESMQRLFNEFFGSASGNVSDSQKFLEHFQRSSSKQIDD